MTAKKREALENPALSYFTNTNVTLDPFTGASSSYASIISNAEAASDWETPVVQPPTGASSSCASTILDAEAASDWETPVVQPPTGASSLCASTISNAEANVTLDPPTGASSLCASTISNAEATSTTGHTTNYKEMLKQVEARSKRLQCLIQPSLFNKVKAIADRRGVSLNDIIHTTLEALAENERQ